IEGWAGEDGTEGAGSGDVEGEPELMRGSVRRDGNPRVAGPFVPAARTAREFRWRHHGPGLPAIERDVARDPARAAGRVAVLLPQSDQVRKVRRVDGEGRLHLRVRKEGLAREEGSFAARPTTITTTCLRERRRDERDRERNDAPRSQGHRGAIPSAQ